MINAQLITIYWLGKLMEFPVERATARPANGVFVCCDNVLLSWDKITKAASQKQE